MEPVINKDSLIEDIKRLGVLPGDLLYLKVSMRSMGTIQGGATTLIDALLHVLGKEGTIVTSSFVKVYPIRYLQRHKNQISDHHTLSYAGAVANEIKTYPQAKISRHPVQKFVAIGAKAEALLCDHDEHAYAYDVFRKMAEQKGKTLKIGDERKVKGVGTTHVAVGLLGLRQKRPKVGVRFVNKEGKLELFRLNWAGLCQNSFDSFSPLYKKITGAIKAEGSVGGADAKLTRMDLTLQLEMEILKQDPGFLLCDDPDCCDCRLTWEFSNGKPLQYFLRSLFRLKPANLKSFFKNYLCGSYQPHEIKKEDKAEEIKA
jgi:aminoglycoside N3'-acetyltransferase